MRQNRNIHIVYSASERTTIETDNLATVTKEVYKAMSDLNRGIMKFDGADSPKLVTVSTVILLGSIAVLIIWALQSAYAVS
jgi:hypothetical protein